jgi:hypothetical protein
MCNPKLSKLSLKESRAIVLDLGWKNCDISECDRALAWLRLVPLKGERGQDESESF